MIALLAPLVLAAAPDAVADRYAVILEVKTDADGKVTDVTVSGVTELRKANKPVKIDVPDSWVAGARAQIEAKPDQPKSKTYYTYFFYDPGVPFLPQ